MYSRPQLLLISNFGKRNAINYSKGTIWCMWWGLKCALLLSKAIGLIRIMNVYTRTSQSTIKCCIWSVLWKHTLQTSRKAVNRQQTDLFSELKAEYSRLVSVKGLKETRSSGHTHTCNLWLLQTDVFLGAQKEAVCLTLSAVEHERGGGRGRTHTVCTRRHALLPARSHSSPFFAHSRDGLSPLPRALFWRSHRHACP